VFSAKRAEEIIFGNHQNEPRVKKSADEAIHDVIKRGADVTDDDEEEGGDSAVGQGEVADDTKAADWASLEAGRGDEEDLVDEKLNAAAEERVSAALEVGVPVGDYVEPDSENAAGSEEQSGIKKSFNPEGFFKTGWLFPPLVLVSSTKTSGR